MLYLQCQPRPYPCCPLIHVDDGILMFSTTFNNISVIYWRDLRRLHKSSINMLSLIYFARNARLGASCISAMVLHVLEL